jgi:glycerol kinase
MSPAACLSRYLLALDQGTTSSRAIVFSDEAAIGAVAPEELCQLLPQPGWVEHDSLDTWATPREIPRQALAAAGPLPQDRRYRHHQPARNHSPLGSPLRPTSPQRPVLRSAMTETTVLVAALLAGFGAGVNTSTSGPTSLWKPHARFNPQMPPDRAAARRRRWNEALARARDWVTHDR